MTRTNSHERAGEMIKAVLSELKNAGGHAKVKDLFGKAEGKLNLTEHEKAPYEKSGCVRWQSIVHFYAITCVKAGYVQKSGGTWILTPQGEEALKKPASEFIRGARESYPAWRRAHPSWDEDVEETEAEESEIVRQTA